jgi:hypothetical protein
VGSSAEVVAADVDEPFTESPDDEVPEGEAPGADALHAEEAAEEEEEARSAPGRVEELFARIRAAASSPSLQAHRVVPAEPASAPVESADAGTGAPADAGAGAEADAAPGPASAVPIAETQDTAVSAAPAQAGEIFDEAARSRRDELLEPVEADLVRQLKRALQDEQNEVLDRLRRRRRATAADVLPDVPAQAERYQAAAIPSLAEASRRGAAFMSGVDAAAGGDPAPGDAEQWGALLAEDLATPLRQRLEWAFGQEGGAEEEGEADDGATTLADRLSAGYRQCKTEQLEPVAHHHAVAAFSRGALAASPDGTSLRWVVDDDGPCPDCDDNALAGSLPKGEPYPTGQAHPPAHVGCRCLLVAATV